ncbi:protein rolling stone-like [Branchiostoma floridae]|uniref:Protein rolling stone-like n=1 Tax=Branchiostoma floridae TaxID=7739 RepID=A0A9J7MGC5_BRAFL|nr:protein rolling stone-like [Branchiostoma floridae]
MVICLFQVVAFIYCLLSFYTTGPKYLLYLTNLAYVLLTAHTTFSAALCVVDYFKSRRHSRGCTEIAEDRPTVVETVPTETDDFLNSSGNNPSGMTTQERTASDVRLPWYYKCYWVLYSIAFAVGLYVTIAYWILLRGADDTYSAYSILTHGINCVVIVIDILVSGLPCRFLHFIYPSSSALAYIIFTVIYWAAGGTDLINRPWIYSVLDYGQNPGLAVGIGMGSIVIMAPLCHGIVFGLAFARDTMLMRVVNKRHLPESECMTAEPQAEERV